MSFVVPRWVARDVRDWDALLIKKPDGSVELSAITAGLLNYMPVIGMPVLNEQNAEEAWRRLAIFQALTGSIVCDTASGRPLFLTQADVTRHIGVETEGESLTFAEFCERLPLPQRCEAQEKLPAFIANGCKTSLEKLGLAE